MEKPDYRDNLAMIIDFVDGRRMLTMAEVQRFTGLKDQRSVSRRYPMNHGVISAATFARAICSEGGNNGR